MLFTQKVTEWMFHQLPPHPHPSTKINSVINLRLMKLDIMMIVRELLEKSKEKEQELFFISFLI